MSTLSKVYGRYSWLVGFVSFLLVAWLVQLVPTTRLVSGQSVTGNALLPPLAAILLAIFTRRLLLALGGGLAVGALLHFGTGALWLGTRRYLWDNLLDTAHLYIVGFTLLLLGMVQVVARSGGARGIVDAVSGLLNSARRVRVGTVGLGMAIFFDDYANCMLVGPTMRPLTDRYRVSREKLAYLIDSTAAPVAGLFLVSTWIGYETGQLGEAARDLGLGLSGYALLLEALPFRFYCIFTLLFVLLNAWSGRDFGAMRRAEERASQENKPLRDGAEPLGGVDSRYAEPPAGKPRRWINAALPVGCVVWVTLGGLVVDGGGWSRLQASPGLSLSLAFWRETLGASENNVQVLFGAAGAGALLAVSLSVGQGILTVGEALMALWQGARSGLYAVAVLVLAWGLAAVCKDVGTGPLMVSALGAGVPPLAISLVTFTAAAAVAFSTGTSWGTMAILIPTAAPVAYSLGGLPLLVLAMAAVLDGAIFGDHCSPISDTTLMSSIASSCDHLDHVRTQMPYAMLTMLVAVIAGYLPAGLGLSPWWSYLGGLVLMLVLLFLLGRRAAAEYLS